MKTRIYFKALFVSALAFVCLTTFDSCKKEDKETTLEDIINLAPAESFKTELNNVSSLSALPSDLKTAATTITSVISASDVAKINALDINAIIQAYQTNSKLSADEVTKLKNNDPTTYHDVILRMIQTSVLSSEALNNYYQTLIGNSALKARLLIAPEIPSDFYAVNLYQGALDLQNFITTYTIPDRKSTRLNSSHT